MGRVAQGTFLMGGFPILYKENLRRQKKFTFTFGHQTIFEKGLSLLKYATVSFFFLPAGPFQFFSCCQQLKWLPCQVEKWHYFWILFIFYGRCTLWSRLAHWTRFWYCSPTAITIWALSSVQFSCSVVSDSLRPHELQHTRPPCPSPTPGTYSNSCPLSRWCHPVISYSVVPFSSCPQSLPASGSFPMSQLFAWGGQSIGVSASASVLTMNT